MERRSAKDGTPQRVVLIDCFKTSAGDQRITHVIWSLEPFHEPDEAVAGSGVRLQLGALNVEISPAPTALGQSTFSPEDLNLRDYQGRTLYRIEAVFRTDEKGRLTVETRLG
jgi:hypothetical protein